MRAKILLAGIQRQWNEGGAREQTDDNTSCEVVMLRPIRTQCVGVCTSNQLPRIRGDADKSWDRLTPQCRRTESTVSLERGVCSCAKLQVFSCYWAWKEVCQTTHAI